MSLLNLSITSLFSTYLPTDKNKLINTSLISFLFVNCSLSFIKLIKSKTTFNVSKSNV